MEIFAKQNHIKKIIFILCAILCLTQLVSSPVALVLGFLVACFLGNPYERTSKKASSLLLKISVVGLGFGMNVTTAVNAGKDGFFFTIISIIFVMTLGFILTKIFNIDKITGYLISAGTSICGGSAIAALSPISGAKDNQISVALAIIFTLNSIALLIFPPLGKLFHMTQHEFGLWAAIAIHDTSSVVGAASKYGEEALQIATTVKLARALWIIPLSVFTLFIFKSSTNKINIPWFIGFFLVAIYINTYVPLINKISPSIVMISRGILTLTLFLIGTNLSIEVIKK